MDYITIKTEGSFDTASVASGSALLFLKNAAGVFSLGVKGSDGLFYTISNKDLEDRITALEAAGSVSLQQVDEISFENSIIFG